MLALAPPTHRRRPCPLGLRNGFLATQPELSKAIFMKVQVLISEDKIKKRVKELAKQISEDYNEVIAKQENEVIAKQENEVIAKQEKNKDLLVLGILKGSFVFLADLMRALQIPVECDFLKARSYAGNKSSGNVKIDFLPAVKEKDVLLIEDIIDTGLTINSIKKEIKNQKPKSLKLCSLLSKPACREQKVEIDYLGFEVPDKFVVGYGLDYQEKFRNLPYVGEINGTN